MILSLMKMMNRENQLGFQNLLHAISNIKFLSLFMFCNVLYLDWSMAG